MKTAAVRALTLALREPAKPHLINGFQLQFPLIIRNLPAAVRSVDCSLTRNLSLYSPHLRPCYRSQQSCFVTPQLLRSEEEIFVMNAFLLPLTIARLPDDNDSKHNAFGYRTAETRCSVFCSFGLPRSEEVSGRSPGASPQVEGRKRHRTLSPQSAAFFQPVIPNQKEQNRCIRSLSPFILSQGAFASSRCICALCCTRKIRFLLKTELRTRF